MGKKAKEKEKPQTDMICAVDSCTQPGEYKAPVSRYQTDKYQYLCLNHIREFNKAWDYFDGWSRKEIEGFMDSAAYGHRPTWSISGGHSKPFLFTSEELRDSFFRMLGEKPPKGFSKKSASVGRKEREAFAIMDLETDADMTAIKSQYKKLVKKYHPDVNKNDKQSEETFKRITSAYKFLIKIYGGKNEN